jgi:hypothetical protein
MSKQKRKHQQQNIHLFQTFVNWNTTWKTFTYGNFAMAAIQFDFHLIM